MNETVVHKFRLVSFLIPIIDDEIWLSRRNTEPAKGSYGAIGGKNKRSLEEGLFDVPHILDPQRLQYNPPEDFVSRYDSRELLSETATREFCEEIFSNLRYPQDFSEGDITDLLRIGFIGDILPHEPNTTNLCYFYLGTINRRDFSLNRRELADFRPLSTIPKEKVYILTRMALQQLKHLHWLYQQKGGYLPFNENHFVPSILSLLDQEIGVFKDTDMVGMHFYYNKKGIKMPETIHGRPPITSIEEALYLGLTPAQIVGYLGNIITQRLAETS